MFVCVNGLAALKRVGVKGVEIRKAEQLQSVRALIIPGGESTTMAKLAEYHNLVWVCVCVCVYVHLSSFRKALNQSRYLKDVILFLRCLG